MTAPAQSRNFALELRQIDDELVTVNEEYDRLAATGSAQAMQRVQVRINALEQRRRNVEAAERGEREIRKDAEQKADLEARGAAYQLSDAAITAVQREALILDRLVKEAREVFKRVRLAEKEIVPPLYRFLSLRDREFVSVDLKTLLVEAKDLEELLTGTHAKLPLPPVAHAVTKRCVEARAMVTRLLYPEQQ